MKLPKFLLMENPMQSEELFIYHSEFPRLICQVIDDREIVGIEELDKIEGETAMRIPSLMREMGEWYMEYCEWEDDESPTLN